MHFRFEHDFDIEPAPYWDLFFSEDYNVDLYRQLKMKDRVVLEQREDGNLLKRSVRFSPEEEIPAVFRSVIKDLGYTERDVFDRARSSMEVVIEPELMKSKFDFRGVYSVRPSGPGKCKRLFEGDIKVSIMLIGGQIEKYMIDRLRTSYDIAADVTRRWIEKKKQPA